jgi:hypothetical protein
VFSKKFSIKIAVGPAIRKYQDKDAFYAPPKRLFSKQQKNKVNLDNCLDADFQIKEIEPKSCYKGKVI